ncbi:MAG: sigma-70 family RNA polymerase sigma factor [Bacteroidales bacterium]|nr:sigma-70 family RNA polymerase sigma factor [Bacteroidales bacterium]
MEIREVIKHCKSGNQLAQSILFNAHYKQMYHLSMRILSNHHDVEDALIISFTKVFSSIQRFEYRGDNSLVKWIKTIVINESIRQLNGKNKINFDEEEFPENAMTTMSDSELYDIDIEQVYNIIEALPAGYRMVFNLFALEGYSHKEISELLNITESTSKSQLRKARTNIIESINKTKKMETNKIDFIVKKAINESENYYDSKANSARERIWNQVQLQSSDKHTSHFFRLLVAACILLFISTSVVSILNMNARNRIKTLVALNSALKNKATMNYKDSSITEETVKSTYANSSDTAFIKNVAAIIKPVVTIQQITDTVFINQIVYVEKEQAPELLATTDKNISTDSIYQRITVKNETEILIVKNESLKKEKNQ